MASRRNNAGEWICTRRFIADAQAKRMFATARVGRPQKSGKDWACKLFISNIGMKAPVLVYGVDQMQAVILALEGALTTLRNSGTEWRWVHGARGEIGIPQFVPGGFGRKFASRLESIIDAEIEKFVAMAKKRRRTNTARRRSRARQSKSD
jgi:hypothetical protein